MRLDAYTRALTQARDAVCEEYWVRTGALIPEDVALEVATTAITAFLNAAKGSPNVPAGCLGADPRGTQQIHAGG